MPKRNDLCRNARRRLLSVWLAAAVAAFFGARSPAAEPLDFTRMVAHWDAYSDPGYLRFIDDARPEIAQVGFYGGHFWSLADTPFGKGYPAHFPVQGYRECGEWFKRLNGELHRRDVKVVGHFNVKMLVGDPESPEGPRGFFRFFQQWDSQRLGPRPTDNPLALLEVDREGKPISNDAYKIGGMREYWACLNSPAWRAVLKAWVKFGIEQGVDGFIVNYFYRHDCHCEHCVAGFKRHLQERYSAAELQQRFEIADIASHRFNEIGAWHDPAQSTPLRMEALRFSQIASKRAFDEVLVQHGRSLKPDLIVAQWNHLGDFGQISGDERCLLPAKQWGADEDYLWYSTGGATNATNLAAGVLGEATLQTRYIRGAFADKPFTLGKYEDTRIRMAIAELAANGGAPMGFYTRFTDPAAREEIVRYYSFLRRYDAIYRGNRLHAEARLLFPRTKIHEGNLAPLARFKEIGKRLLDEHVLFDVVPDDLPAARETTSGVLRIVDPSDPAQSAASVIDGSPAGRSRFDVPRTVRVSANRSAGPREITLHFVNYNRQEPGENDRLGGIKDERPIAADAASVQFRMPPKTRATRVEFMTPEKPDAEALPFEHKDGALTFRIPGYLVYGVVRIETDPVP